MAGQDVQIVNIAVTPDRGIVLVQVNENSAGAKGDKGDKGEKGERGYDGIQGKQGERGLRGADGSGVPAGGVVGQVLAKAGIEDGDVAWEDPTAGSGDMRAEIYDPTNQAKDAFDMDNMLEGDINKLVSAEEKSSWDGKQPAGSYLIASDIEGKADNSFAIAMAVAL